MESEDIPSAEDFLLDYEQEYFQGAVYGDFAYKQSEVIKAMLAFAKAHTKRALKTAASTATTKFVDNRSDSKTPTMWDITVDRDKILNSYPEDLIK